MKNESATAPISTPSHPASAPAAQPGRASKRWFGLLLWGVVVMLIVAGTAAWIQRVQAAAPGP